MLKDRMIAEFVAVHPNDGKQIQEYDAAGLRFKWSDWVECQIAWGPSNPVHWCIAASFREHKKKDGTLQMTATLFSPCYEECAMEDVKLDNLHYFKPIRVIEEVRTPPVD